MNTVNPAAQFNNDTFTDSLVNSSIRFVAGSPVMKQKYYQQLAELKSKNQIETIK